MDSSEDAAGVSQVAAEFPTESSIAATVATAASAADEQQAATAALESTATYQPVDQHSASSSSDNILASDVPSSTVEAGTVAATTASASAPLTATVTVAAAAGEAPSIEAPFESTSALSADAVEVSSGASFATHSIVPSQELQRSSTPLSASTSDLPGSSEAAALVGNTTDGAGATNGGPFAAEAADEVVATSGSSVVADDSDVVDSENTPVSNVDDAQSAVAVTSDAIAAVTATAAADAGVAAAEIPSMVAGADGGVVQNQSTDADAEKSSNGLTSGDVVTAGMSTSAIEPASGDDAKNNVAVEDDPSGKPLKDEFGRDISVRQRPPSPVITPVAGGTVASAAPTATAGSSDPAAPAPPSTGGGKGASASRPRGSHKPSRRGHDGRPNSRLFLGNLASERLTKQQLEAMFSKYGEVMDVSLHRSFGFVQFTNANDAAVAMEHETGKVLAGLTLDIHFATSREETPKPSRREREKRGPPPSHGPPPSSGRRGGRGPFGDGPSSGAPRAKRAALMRTEPPARSSSSRYGQPPPSAPPSHAPAALPPPDVAILIYGTQPDTRATADQLGSSLADAGLHAAAHYYDPASTFHAAMDKFYHDGVRFVAVLPDAPRGAPATVDLHAVQENPVIVEHGLRLQDAIATAAGWQRYGPRSAPQPRAREPAPAGPRVPRQGSGNFGRPAEGHTRSYTTGRGEPVGDDRRRIDTAPRYQHQQPPPQAAPPYGRESRESFHSDPRRSGNTHGAQSSDGDRFNRGRRPPPDDVYANQPRVAGSRHAAPLLAAPTVASADPRRGAVLAGGEHSGNQLTNDIYALLHTNGGGAGSNYTAPAPPTASQAIDPRSQYMRAPPAGPPAASAPGLDVNSMSPAMMQQLLDQLNG